MFRQTLHILTALVLCAGAGPLSASSHQDAIQFGDASSEAAHHLTTSSSNIIQGGGGLYARQLLPLSTESREGGAITFTMKVDPVAQNYYTVKLWGSDMGGEHGRLILSCDGKQVGYRDQGDVDALDIPSNDPRFPNHFYYTTVPLALSSTKGKSEVTLSIQVIGEIWVYGDNAEKYQKQVRFPSRGIYAGYTQTEPYFIDPQAAPVAAPIAPPVRKDPPGILNETKMQVNSYLIGLMRNTQPLDEYRTETLARAYSLSWTTLHNSKDVASKVAANLDELMRRYNRQEDLPAAPKGVPNGWFGYGPAGLAITEIAETLQPLLNANIDDGTGGKIVRREGWSRMLIASRDYWRQHRRLYTNQSMIVDLNIYRANRGLEVVDPKNALSEPEARRYLYEAMGILPWTGSDTLTSEGKLVPAATSDAGTTPYYTFTHKGLSKELGYVGGYGEILDWAEEIYHATEVKDDDGDPKIREQLKFLLHARSFFREPGVDEKGFRTMRLEQVIGWRDHEFPGILTYTSPTRSEGSALALAAVLGDSTSVGYTAQMLDDHQFLQGIERTLSDHGARNERMLLEVPGDWNRIAKLPPSSVRLPMSTSAPDTAFADEEDGVLALKHGDELLYVSLYWRAHMGINHLARVHFFSLGMERDATAAIQESFTPSGETYTLPNLPNRPHVPTPWLKLPGVTLDRAGEQLPIAASPTGSVIKPGSGEPSTVIQPYNGRASFYSLHYGRYLIGMNASSDKSFPLLVPEGVKEVRELISGKIIPVNGPVTVRANSTVVLYLPE
jgi:hypothetical protein